MLGKLLCAAALVSAACAQNIDIALPVAGTTVTAGSAITIQLERPTPSTATKEVAVVIGISPCPGGACTNDGLGTVLYNGPFDPESTNGAGNAFQNFTVTAPNWFNGLAQLRVAHFYLLGANTNTAELQLADTTSVTLVGATG